MAGTRGGLTTSIRRKLHDGKTPEEIIQELVAGGMTELSAQRFVDRAITEDASAPPLPDTPIDSLDQFMQSQADDEVKAAGKQLWVSSGLMSVGIAITAGSYIMASAGERYVAMWGIIAVGVLMWGRAVFSGLQDRHAFPWSTALASLAVPMVLAGAAYGYVANEPLEESDLQAQMDEIFDPSKSAPRPDPNTITIKETPAPPGLSEVEQLFYTFDNSRAASLQCEMARRLGFTQRDDKTEALTGLLGRFGLASDEVKVCVLRAVQKLDPEAAKALERRQ